MPVSEWVSWAEAARITGIPVHVIEWWKRQGRIEHRPHDGYRPTLRRSSVEEFGNWYRERQRERVRLREERSAVKKTRTRRAHHGSREGWLHASQAAARLGISRRSLLRWVEHLGAERRGTRG